LVCLNTKKNGECTHKKEPQERKRRQRRGDQYKVHKLKSKEWGEEGIRFIPSNTVSLTKQHNKQDVIYFGKEKQDARFSHNCSSCFLYLCLVFSHTHKWGFNLFLDPRNYPPFVVLVQFLSTITQIFLSPFLYIEK
jgi:hypothetical protein